jgi:hypothetical protein
MSEKKISQQALRQTEASPSMGATPVAGKSNDAYGAEVARKAAVKRNKPEAVREVKADEGAHERCVNQQTGNGDSNPKKRQE